MFKKFKNERGAISAILMIVVFLAIVGFGVYYFVYSGATEEVVTDPYLKAIKDAGKVTIALDATYAPMEYVDDNGDIVGLDVDIAKEIAADLGVEAEFVPYDWDVIFDAVQDGDVNMIMSSVTITTDRAKVMTFSDPYFNAGQVMVVLETNTDVTMPEDMVGKKVGVQTNTTSMDEVVKYADADMIVEYEEYSTAVDDLKDGTVEIVVIDYTAGLGLLNESTGLKLANDPFTQEFYGVVVQKTDETDAFLVEINKSIRDLKESGKITEFEKKWL